MKRLKERINEFTIRFKGTHAEIRWRERCIPKPEIEEIVWQWDVIEETANEFVLLWGKLDDRRIVHVACEVDLQEKIIYVLTSYVPDERFSPESDYRVRVKK